MVIKCYDCGEFGLSLMALGVGSEIQYPLSVVIVGGIISSTMLTLLVLPVGYFLMNGGEVKSSLNAPKSSRGENGVVR